MSGTPIFDELYAKYVVASSGVAGTTAAHSATTPVAEKQHDDRPAAQYTGRHQTLVWPS